MSDPRSCRSPERVAPCVRWALIWTAVLALLVTVRTANAQSHSPSTYHGNDYYQAMRLDSQIHQSMLGTQRMLWQMHNEFKQTEQLLGSKAGSYAAPKPSDLPWFTDQWRLGLNARQVQTVGRRWARQLDRYGRWFELKGNREAALMCYREAIRVAPETSVPSRVRLKYLTGEG